MREKSCTSQLLNLTEHIEDGYEKRLITGAVFVDLSAAYDTVNHRRLLSKVLEMTGDVQLTDRLDTHHAVKQTLLRGAEREEEPLATTTKPTTTGKCTDTDVVQHLHLHQPAHTPIHTIIKIISHYPFVCRSIIITLNDSAYMAQSTLKECFTELQVSTTHPFRVFTWKNIKFVRGFN